MTRAPVLATLVALVGCGPAAAAPTRKAVAAAPEGSPWADALTDAVRRMNEISGGRLAIRAVLGGVGGDEVDTARACAEGKIFLWAGSAGAIAQVVPELNALELPFLLDDERQVDAALTSGRVLALLGKAFERQGLTFGPGFGEVGWRSFAGPRPLRSPADLAGVRVRSQESPIHLAMWTALGAIPKAISVLEGAHALQAGAVEAFDQSPVYMFATSWYQHARVYTLSRHIYQPAVAAFCKGALAGLPAAEKSRLIAAILPMAPATIKSTRALVGDVLTQLRREGLTIVELTPAERAVFRECTRKVREDFRASTTPLGREILAAIEQALEGKRR